MDNTTTDNTPTDTTPADNLTAPSKPSKPSFIMSWSPILLVLALLGLYFVTSRPSEPPAGWGQDYHQAVAQAAKTDRQVVVAFYMDGCPPCSAMDRTVLRTPEVRKSLSNFVPVRVDVNRDFQLANQFGVYGTPTYAVLNADEKLVAKCEGMQSTEAFVQFLARAALAKPTNNPSHD